MTDELTLNHDDLRNLHRHYINLTCMNSGEPAKASNGGNPKRYNFSAFVVDVEGVLLAITAGHVFAKLKQAVAHGSVLSDWAIDDSMVTDHGFPAYPVDVSLEKDILFFHEDGLDYGAYLLDPMHRARSKRAASFQSGRSSGTRRIWRSSRSGLWSACQPSSQT